MQVTAVVIYLGDDIAEVYDLLKDIDEDQLDGWMKWARHSIEEELGLSEVTKRPAIINFLFPVAYAENDPILNLLDSRRRVRNLIEVITKVQSKIAAGSSQLKRGLINEMISVNGEVIEKYKALIDSGDEITQEAAENFLKLITNDSYLNSIYLSMSTATSEKRANQIANALANFPCRYGVERGCYMGGVGSGSEGLLKWFGFIEEIDTLRKANPDLMPDEAWQGLSQVFVEAGAEGLNAQTFQKINKAKGATEVVALTKSLMEKGVKIVGFEVPVDNVIRNGGARKFDLVVEESVDGVWIQRRVEVKAWNPQNPELIAKFAFLNIRGKKLTDLEIEQFAQKGISPSEIQNVVNDRGQLFEDIVVNLRKATNSQGKIDLQKVKQLERELYFDGRMDAQKRQDFVYELKDLIIEDQSILNMIKGTIGKEIQDEDLQNAIYVVLNKMVKANA